MITFTLDRFTFALTKGLADGRHAATADTSDILAAIEQNTELREAVERRYAARAEAAEKERDALRAQVEAMRPVVEAARVFNQHHWQTPMGAARTPKRDEWEEELTRLGELLNAAISAAPPPPADNVRPAAEPPPAPLCRVCGKMAHEGKHATELGEGHDYEPGARPAPSGFVPGARVRVRMDADCPSGLRGCVGTVVEPTDYQRSVAVHFSAWGMTHSWKESNLDLLPATPAAPVRDEPVMSPADAEELRARRDAEGWERADANHRELRALPSGRVRATHYGAHRKSVDAETWPDLCRALGLEGWK